MSKSGVGAIQKSGSGRDPEPLHSMSQTSVIFVVFNYFAQTLIQKYIGQRDAYNSLQNQVLPQHL